MARPKKEEKAEEKTEITHLSLDFGREDLNNLARKVNEIIDHING